MTKFLRICIETLSSLPSIVVGLFGYLVFLVFFGLGKSLLAGALSISILAIPVITTTTEDAINGLPDDYLQASLGLGATRWQSIYHVLLPACIPRIMTGVILAAGRGFGEAAALLYTTGSGTDLRWNNWNLTSPNLPAEYFPSGRDIVIADLGTSDQWTGSESCKPVSSNPDDSCSAVQHWRKCIEPTH